MSYMLVRSPLFLEKPFVLCPLKSTSKLQCIVAPLAKQLFVVPFHERVPVPPCEAMHVIFDAPKFATRPDEQSMEASPLRIVMQLNALLTVGLSTHFLQMPNPRYCASLLPTLNKSAPDGLPLAPGPYRRTSGNKSKRIGRTWLTKKFFFRDLMR